MRKFILTLVLVMAFSSPAWAGSIIVNGVLYSNVNTIEKNDKTYVPIRFVSEALNYSVDYDDGTVKIYQLIKRPQIIGDDDFKNVVNQALSELEAKEPTSFINVCKYTDVIELSDLSGRDGFSPGGRKICLTKELENSSRFNSVYVAAALVHETTHEIQFGYGFDKTMSINKLEFEAYGKGINTLIQLGAPQDIINGMIENQNKIIN